MVHSAIKVSRTRHVPNRGATPEVVHIIKLMPSVYAWHTQRSSQQLGLVPESLHQLFHARHFGADLALRWLIHLQRFNLRCDVHPQRVWRDLLNGLLLRLDGVWQ